MPLWLPAYVIFDYVCYIVSVSEASKYSQAVRHIVPHVQVNQDINSMRTNTIRQVSMLTVGNAKQVVSKTCLQA